MKKGIYRAAAALLAAVLFPLNAAATPQISAEKYILMDGDTGNILCAQKETDEALIASTTKIMTALVVIEHCPPEQRFTVPAEAVGVEGSSMYLKAGEVLTVEELLYGLLLQSGNDAAVALALACSDSVPEFVALMNLKAQELCLRETHFENPSGLDGETHRSSARDLARLTAYALKNPLFKTIVSTKSISVGQRQLRNHNKLLWQIEGAVGVKTGYTRAAGRTLVSAVEQKGRQLIAVTLRDGNDWQDHRRLYDYGFACYEERRLVSRGDCVFRIPLMCGGCAELTAAEDFYYCAMEADTFQMLPMYPTFAFAPGCRGSHAGYAAVFLGQRQVGKIELQWGGVCPNGTATENIVRIRDRFP